MKILYTLILSITFKCCFAQVDTTFTKTDVLLYGTKAEKIHQQQIERQTPNRFLCRLIGFKEYYLNDLGEYIQSDMGFTNDDSSPFKAGFNIEYYTKKGIYSGNSYPKKLKLVFAVNKDGKIKSGIITGQFAHLAYLFINYWPQSPDWATEQQLKPGVVAQKHSFGDLVTFNWNGATPFIKVTADPSMSFPVPQLSK